MMVKCFQARSQKYTILSTRYLFFNVRHLQSQVRLYCVWWNFVTIWQDGESFEFLREGFKERGVNSISGQLITKSKSYFVVVVYVSMFQIKLYIIQKIYMLDRENSRPILHTIIENKKLLKKLYFYFWWKFACFHFFPTFLLNISPMLLMSRIWPARVLSTTFV